MGIIKFQKKEINTLAIWEITESMDRLYDLAMLNEKEKAHYNSFNSENRKKEWLSTRALTREILGEPTKIGYRESGSPYLINSTLHISISHTVGYAAIYLNNAPCGVDIELQSRNFERASKKYIQQPEMDIISKCGISQSLGMGMIWCAKEAAYKANESLQGASFTEEITVTDLYDQTITLNCRGNEVKAKIELWNDCIICTL